MSAIIKLDAAIKAVCPITGVSIGDPEDKATWRIDFLPEASTEQQADAQAVVDAFAWNDGPDVPAVVTMRQARIALLRAGLLSQVDAAIAAMPAETGGDEARITWAYGAEVRRDGPLIGQLAPGLGLTDEQIDNLFIEAATL